MRLFNGRDGEFLANLEEIGKRGAGARVGACIRPQSQLLRRVHLIFAPIKKARLDILIEKAVELGATDLHPVMTARTENRKANPDKLELQMIEALEQCERLHKPALHAAQTLPALLKNWKDSPIMACVERAEAAPLAKALPQGDIALLIGPEGGFTPDEIAAISASPACTPVSLGEAVLRAETAALCGLSIIGAQPE
ncbi:MAG TPA: RsmE family RNA methyltransferase [Alphaproteobacteria bacterium]|nr:RsmE family RNA methyltransferase [Alphaproteobacteria bacterium]